MKNFVSLQRILINIVDKMKAVDLQTSTFLLLQQMDKTNAELWEKVHDAVVAIWQGEKVDTVKKRAAQKNKIRQMVGILPDNDKDWKFAKEDFLTEKYL